MGKVLFFVIAAVAVLSVALFFVFGKDGKPLTKGETEKEIARILGRKPILTDISGPKGSLQYKGKYVSFLYPANARKYTQKLNGMPVPTTTLESFIYDTDFPKITLYMEVDSSPAVKSVSDYPSVKLRRLQDNIYTQDLAFADDVEGLSFEKTSNQGNEKTAFFYVNGRVISFSFQGSDLKELRSAFEKTLATVKFL